MGRFDVNIETYEGKLSRGQTLDKMEYLYLCEAYVSAKNYAKIFPCADGYVQAEMPPLSVGTDDIKANASARADSWRAEAYLETARYAEALSTVERALAGITAHGFMGRPHGLEYKLYGLKGIAQAYLGDKDGALRTVGEIEKVSCGFVGGAYCGEEKGQALAGVYVALKRYADAFKVLDEATIMKAWGSFVLAGGWDVYMVPRYFLQAKVKYETGRVAEAKAEYEALLGKPSINSSGTIHWSVLYDLGRIARAEGDADGAARRFSQAVEVIESQRANINTEAAKIGFIGDKQAVYGALVSLLVERGRAAEALEYVERGKSRALVDLLAERKDLAPQDQAGAAETLAQLAGLERKYAISSAGAASGDTAQLRSALSATRDGLRRQAPELASLVTVSAPRAADIQAQIAPDQTLLEYYGQGDELFAFVVTRESVRALRLDGRGLEAEVRRLRASVAKASGEEWRPLAERLHARLIAPVPGVLDRPRLTIVAHGALHYLPWSALTDGRSFVIERAALTLLPSASVMRFLAARVPATQRQMLILGNPDLGDKNYDLPGAEAEARAIRAIWPDSTVLLRRQAAKSAITRAGGLFRMIHVAAHGEFSSDRPLDSALLLTPEGGGGDGRLTAGDLYSMRLSADLVTLSACETGMGKVLSGDDVIGLTRGFLYAGANSIVASLWPVSDAETQDLMTGFYKNLKSMPKAEALRRAQRETMRKYPHPFYWSAFQLTGAGR
jgi:CHAT domain-containing protein